ncbi:MAG: FAD-binding oxidoreductase [Oscillospiraceae bacterium]|nr:FAD-binding oxidoreductase [Oscillospiraceae bacterium]
MKSYDVVVIGSGLIGVATAYEAVKSGRRTALLDAKGLSAGASSANASMLLLEGSCDCAAFSICMDAVALYERLDEELGCQTGFGELGHISLLEKESEFAPAAAASAFYRSRGLDSAILAREEVARREPGLNLKTVLGGMSLRQWRIDPIGTVAGYFHAARALGLDWYPHCAAEEFITQGDRLLAVKTPQGDIAGGQFVVAAGAWTRELLAKLRLFIPEYHITGAAMICERGAVELRHAVYPFTSPRVAMEQRAAKRIAQVGWERLEREHANEFVVVPDANGNLLVCQRSHASAEFVSRVPTEYMRDMAQNALKYFPAFASARVLRSWMAPVPFVPDGAPFFGFAAPYGNLFISSGFGSVLIMAPAIAKLTSRLLGGGTVPYDLGAFDPMRFSKEV